MYAQVISEESLVLHTFLIFKPRVWLTTTNGKIDTCVHILVKLLSSPDASALPSTVRSQDHAHALCSPLQSLQLSQVGKEQTHSLSKGMDVLLLLFWTMLAWFRKEMRIIAGASLQGSPSTCMGMDL